MMAPTERAVQGRIVSTAVLSPIRRSIATPKLEGTGNGAAAHLVTISVLKRQSADAPGVIIDHLEAQLDVWSPFA